jgi:glycosyltransferase involved in cell wall biosynthesis
VRVALVHHWLVRRRGGEKCLDSLARLLPGADLFTLIHDPDACPAPSGIGRVITSRLQNRPGAKRWFRAWLPRFPRLYGELDLSGYDLVVTSDASVAKTVRVPEGVPHVCYCYSPVRYAFDLREVYLRESVPGPLRPLARHVLDRLADADREAASRVTAFVAISNHVADRIARCYERPSEVVYPPVDVRFFRPAEVDATVEPATTDATRPYLLLGEAVAYKRFDLGVLACRALDRDLVVAGRGPHFDKLRRLAGPRTRFVPEPDDETVRNLYRNCRALLFPGEEDFGIVPVEAMACGRPVIALNVGGATETVVDASTGILYDDDSVDGLINALRRFESWEDSYLTTNAVTRAGMFSVHAHERAMKRILATFDY